MRRDIGWRARRKEGYRYLSRQGDHGDQMRLEFQPLEGLRQLSHPRLLLPQVLEPRRPCGLTMWCGSREVSDRKSYNTM